MWGFLSSFWITSLANLLTKASVSLLGSRLCCQKVINTVTSASSRHKLIISYELKSFVPKNIPSKIQGKKHIRFRNDRMGRTLWNFHDTLHLWNISRRVVLDRFPLSLVSYVRMFGQAVFFRGCNNAVRIPSSWTEQKKELNIEIFRYLV